MKNTEFIYHLIQLKKGNKDSCEKIYSAYFYKLQAVSMKITKNQQDAYDVASNVVLKLFDYDGDPQNIKNHIAFLMTMVHNESIDWVRKKKTVSIDKIREPVILPNDTLWLTDIMMTLSEEEYAIFVEHVIWERDLKTIALTKGISYITIKRKYKIIKEKIKKLY